MRLKLHYFFYCFITDNDQENKNELTALANQIRN